MYITSCPQCNARDSLYIIGGIFLTKGMPLRRDGFEFKTARELTTEDVVVLCFECTRQFTLTDLNDGKEPSDDKRLKIKGD